MGRIRHRFSLSRKPALKKMGFHGNFGVFEAGSQVCFAFVFASYVYILLRVYAANVMFGSFHILDNIYFRHTEINYTQLSYNFIV